MTSDSRTAATLLALATMLLGLTLGASYSRWQIRQAVAAGYVAAKCERVAEPAQERCRALALAPDTLARMR